MKMGNKDDAFAKSFKASLRKWGGYNALSIDDDSHLITEVSEHIAGIYQESMAPRRYREEGREDEWRQVAHVARAFLNAFLIQELDRRTDGPGCIHNLLELTESPIEATLLLALVLCAREHDIDITIEGQDPTSKYSFFTRYEGNLNQNIRIQPQANIGDYRVDLLLRFSGSRHQKIEPELPRTKTLWQEVPIESKVIVECDGHEYHERTKEQARKDKSRDRKLQSIGYPVYRYTGSEIYGDPFSCASEVVEVLTGISIEE